MSLDALELGDAAGDFLHALLEQHRHARARRLAPLAECDDLPKLSDAEADRSTGVDEGEPIEAGPVVVAVAGRCPRRLWQ